MKKNVLIIFVVLLSMMNVVNAQESVNVKVLLDGQEIIVDGIMAMYKNDASYEDPTEITKDGLALVFAKGTKGNEIWCFSKEVDLKSGDNVLDFNASNMNTYEIVIGKNVHPLDDDVFIEFENLPSETNLELKIQSGNTITVHISDNLQIHRVTLSDVKGSTGINTSQSTELNDGSFGFDGNYYLKPKLEYILMPDRPSFENIFDICYSDDLFIDDMFVMGRGGGCDYKYFDKDGKVVLEGRFGHPSNGLHFEDLPEGVYNMEFTFNEGDLVLISKDIVFLNEKKSLEDKIEDIKQPFKVYVESLPLSGSETDFHELMKKEEDKIVFIIDESKNLDSNILNQNDIKLFHQNNKEFSIKTNFIEVEFNKELIAEMDKTNRDLSMHIKNGLSFYSKEEGAKFMRDTYNILEDMNYICDYEVKIFLSEHDLIAGAFDKRPTLIFYPNDTYLEGVDFRKISVYSDKDKNKTLDLLGGKNSANSIKIELDSPSPYYYFNIYENNITFNDISDSWAKDYIEVMAAKSFINGIGDNKFNPKDTLTKAQFITLLVKAINEKIGGYQGIYNDCKQTDWFTSYVETAYKLGLTNEKKGEEFNPNANISRKEMAVLVVKAYVGYMGSSPKITNPKSFSDVSDISKEDIDYINKATELKLISGMPDGTFKPNNTLTREQAAVIIYRLLNIIN